MAAAEVRPGELVLDIGAGDGALTRPLVAPGSRLVAADLVLQRAVVQRYADLGVSGGRRFQLGRGQTVPRRAFEPPPRVDSAVLVVRRRGHPDLRS